MPDDTLDILVINKLAVPCLIGTFDQERKEKQIIFISLKLSVDTHKAGSSDDLSDTVNYHTLTKHVYDTVTNSTFYLLEKLAQVIADLCLEDSAIKQVVVTIEKPKALALAESALIEITRKNEKK